MPLTPAERQRLYRQRLKEKDPDKFMLQKRKNAERTKINRKNIADYDTLQQQVIRKQWRDKKRRNKETLSAPPNDEAQTPVISNPTSQTNQTSRLLQSHRKLIYKMKKENVTLTEELSTVKNTLRNLKKKIKRSAKKNCLLLKLLEDKDMEISKLRQKLNKNKNEDITTESPQTKTQNFIKNCLPNISSEEKKNVAKKILQHEVVLDTIKESYECLKSTEMKRTLKKVILQSDNVKKYKLKMKMASFLGLKGNIRHTLKKRRNCILLNHLREFYYRDDVSRMTAGKNEVKSQKKEKTQKRYLLGTLKKLYSKYKREGGKMALSTFKKYRPFHVLPPTAANRNTCACKKHDNLEMKARALKSEGVIVTQDIDDLLALIMCDTKSRQCAYGECDSCKEKSIIFSIDGKNLDSNITWFEWVLQSHEYADKTNSNIMKTTKKMVKLEKKDSLKILLKLFKEELQVMKTHSYNITHQYLQYRRCMKTLDHRSVLLHVDFSENYSCKLSKEIQSMHFGSSRQQLTLHTGMLYTANSKLSFASISPNNEHGPDAIWAHLRPVLQWIRNEYPTLDSIHFFSDGPTVQYRQKKSFYLFSQNTKNLGFPFSTWNFFEASHGKGAADGVGGALKRNLDLLVAYNMDIPDAKTAYDLLLKETDTGIKLFYIPDEAIQKESIELTAVPNTMKLHQISNAASENTISYRSLSCFCENDRPGFCNCLDLKQTILTKPMGEDKENKSGPKKTKRVGTGVKLLSDIKTTAENQTYLDVMKYDPFNVKRIDKDLDLSLMSSQHEKVKRKLVTKRTRTVKRLKVQRNSSTDADSEAYSIRDSSDDEYFLSDENNTLVENDNGELGDDHKKQSVDSNDDNMVTEVQEVEMEKRVNNELELNNCEHLVLNNNHTEFSLKSELVYFRDSVLVRYFQRGTWKYYVGFVEDITESDEGLKYSIDFLKKVKNPNLYFVKPKRKDRDVVGNNLIIKKVELLQNTERLTEYFLKNKSDEIYFD